MKVNIVMSTYNGERFLSEQIVSIQKQTFENWTLLIRDDGSNDRTPEIIDAFVKKDERISYINKGERKNIGVINSFFSLIKYEQADYYFFSDQDDVWLPEKMEMMLNEISKRQCTNEPQMIYTDVVVVDQKLRVLKQSMIKSQSHHPNTTLLQELTENTVIGGSSMINHLLAELWQTTENVVMHDWYLALLACATGKLSYIDSPSGLYRQHDQNVLGARTFNKRMRIWLSGPSKMLNKFWSLIKGSQAQAKKLLQVGNIDSEKVKLIKSFINIEQESLLNRIKLIRKYRYAKNKWFYTLVFRVLVITKIGYTENK